MSEFIFEPEKCYRKWLVSNKRDIYMFATGWTVWKLSPVDVRFFAPVQTGPGATQPPVQWVLGLSQG